jgi:HD-GYP domain-containing protein (c-di-GMP phosphodiesterase class II)
VAQLAIVIPGRWAGATQIDIGQARRLADHGVRGHNRRVAALCVRIGRQLGMTAAERRILERSGLLHDIGKLALPGAVLDKHDALDDSEWSLVRTHPQVGLRIMQWAGTFERAMLAVLYHHERMDGTGYPHGLVADAIPIEARVVAVADMYDVLTSDRPYRRARSDREARSVLASEAGPHLDPRLVSALLSALDEEASRPAPGLH